MEISYGVITNSKALCFPYDLKTKRQIDISFTTLEKKKKKKKKKKTKKEHLHHSQF